MPAWSPSDLTNPSFVKTQLSDKDRSNALFTTSNELTSAEARLKQQGAILAAAQEAQNNGPARGQINALKAKSNDTSLPAAEREQAAQQAADLADQRDKNNVAAANALEKFNSTNQYVNDLVVGQSNLLQAGAVPPGVSSFAAPPGYEGRNSPAQDVPASQNATATPIATTQELQSASPALISPNSDPNTNIGAETQTPVPQQPINPNTDPNTNIGADIQTSSPQVPIDGGSDPYVSNGNTTIPVIQNQAPATINADDAIEKARLEAQAEYENTPPRTEQDIIDAYGGMQGLQGSVDSARAQKITQDAENAKTQGDWRVRLSLAPGASYLYKAQDPGILAPLQKTDGVIFPYVPQIQVTYAAHYDPQELTHSNYKIYQYKNSGVDQVVITCDFTAQDNEEANYMLAVIHFFRSVTKMFYGKDQNPSPGTPPPLCYLSGMGDFQFNRHPLVVSSFNYSLPNDVDYIRAGSPTLLSGVSSTGYDSGNDMLVDDGVSCRRLKVNGLNFGGTESAPNWSKSTNTQPTYVPTKMQINITAYPIVTRSDISNNFSLKKYATGELLQGSIRPNGGGIW